MFQQDSVRSTRPRHLALTGAMLALVLALPQSAHAQDTARLQLMGPQVAIYNVAGRVTMQAGSGDVVLVEVTRMGRGAQELEVTTGMIGDVNALRVIYPDDRVVYPEMGRFSTTTMSVRDDGTFGGRSRGRTHRVRITGGGAGLQAWADIRITVPSGRDVSVFIGAGSIKADGIGSNLELDTHSGGVTANNIRGNVLADTGSGDIELSNVQGNVTADTGSGRVDLTDITGDRVVADTGSGRVTASRITAERFDVDTGSGSIDLSRVTAQHVRLDTGSGSVEVELISDIRTLEVDTGSGSVTVWVPASLGAEIEIDTGSGGIDVDVPVEFRHRSRSHVVGTIGDGNGRIYIDTGSGGVRIRKR